MVDNASGPDRTVLVTGGTGGIGRATADGLARTGARVGIVGRDLARARSVATEIAAASGNPAVDAYAADMSSQAEVRRLAGEVLAACPRLDVLVNNVGGYWATRHATVDGLERTFALNHLAPFLLTELLLDRLRASAPARVVTVSSADHAGGRIDFDDLQAERSYSGPRAYGQSKLANVMFTYELARRLAGSGVTATVLHPGVVRTAIGAEDQARWHRVVLPLVRPLLMTPTRGARTSIHLARAAEVDGISGRYFAHRRPTRSSRRSYDTVAAARLWRVSEHLVGLPITTGDGA
jgi:NAD(P)-dependent dehydrogenase (short-subunit alcohol dehydrogenase family)